MTLTIIVDEAETDELLAALHPYLVTMTKIAKQFALLDNCKWAALYQSRVARTRGLINALLDAKHAANTHH